MSNPESQLVAEQETRQEKIREVQERIRREVNLGRLDRQAIADSNAIIIDELADYEEGAGDLLQYDVAAPFIIAEVFALLDLPEETKKKVGKFLVYTYSQTKDQGEKWLREELGYIAEYGESEYLSLVDKIKKILSELIAEKNAAGQIMMERLRKEGREDEFLDLPTDGFSNVLVNLFQRFDEQQYIMKKLSKNIKEAIEYLIYESKKRKS